VNKAKENLVCKEYVPLQALTIGDNYV
jgi:hypothetical protein